MEEYKFRCRHKANSCRKQENPNPHVRQCFACSYLEVLLDNGYIPAEDFGWDHFRGR
jgi:hypothetical protein